MQASLGPFTNPAHLKLEIKHEELTAGRIQCQTLPQQWMLVRCLNCDYGVYAIRVRMTQLQKDNSDDFAVLFNSKLVVSHCHAKSRPLSPHDRLREHNLSRLHLDDR